MTGTSGRSAFAFGKSSRPLIPGMLMSDKIRINDAHVADALEGAVRRLGKLHGEPTAAKIAPKLLAKQHLNIGFVVNDENK
jgi:hypothetical protein